MTTTTDTGLDPRSDAPRPNNVRRWAYSVTAIAFAGVAGYLLAYSIGIVLGGSATVSETIVQLMGGFFAGALCVLFMRFASKHAPKQVATGSS